MSNSKYQLKGDSLSRKNLRISDIIAKNNGKKSTSKSNKKEESHSIEYGTDSKRPIGNKSNSLELEEMRAVIMGCNSCLEKISQFTTKKHPK